MLILRFSNPADRAALQSDRSPVFRFEAGFITAQPQGGRIATYSAGQWWVRDKGFLNVECDGPLACSACAAELERSLGLFAGVRLLDGVLLADERPIARMRGHEGWEPPGATELWARIVLEAA